MTTNEQDESAIRNVLLRYCRGIDRLDFELVRSCYWPDATDKHGPFEGSRDEFIDWTSRLLERHTMTMHHVGNILIEFPDDRHSTAATETYAVAYHSGEPADDIRWNYVAGFRYVDLFEQRDTEWRIADRHVVIEWVTPWSADRSRLTDLGGTQARRDRNDPVYKNLKADR
jgi:hypothetical protein